MAAPTAIAAPAAPALPKVYEVASRILVRASDMASVFQALAAHYAGIAEGQDGSMAILPGSQVEIRRVSTPAAYMKCRCGFGCGYFDTAPLRGKCYGIVQHADGADDHRCARHHEM